MKNLEKCVLRIVIALMLLIGPLQGAPLAFFEPTTGPATAAPSSLCASELEQVQVAQAPASFFRSLGVEATVGRTFTEEEDRPGSEAVILLSHQLWKSRFSSDPKLVGREVLLEGKTFRIIGVLPPDFAPPSILSNIDVWVPQGQFQDQWT